MAHVTCQPTTATDGTEKPTGRLFVEDDSKFFHRREFSKTLKMGKDNVEVV
jgi:hypothetical protein